MVDPSVAHSFVRVVAEGDGSGDESNNQMRRQAVRSFVDQLQKPSLPPVLLQVIAWVLGEYAYLLDDLDAADVIEHVLDILERTSDSDTRSWAVSALVKLSAQLGSSPEQVNEASWTNGA